MKHALILLPRLYTDGVSEGTALDCRERKREVLHKDTHIYTALHSFIIK